MFSIPGFEAFYTALEDADSDEHESSELEEDRDCSQKAAAAKAQKVAAAKAAQTVADI